MRYAKKPSRSTLHQDIEMRVPKMLDQQGQKACTSMARVAWSRIQVALDLFQNLEIGWEWSVTFFGFLGLNLGKGHEIRFLKRLLTPAHSFCFFIASGHEGQQLGCTDWVAFEKLQTLVNKRKDAKIDDSLLYGDCIQAFLLFPGNKMREARLDPKNGAGASCIRFVA
jgi:hypothetical protein